MLESLVRRTRQLQGKIGQNWCHEFALVKYLNGLWGPLFTTCLLAVVLNGRLVRLDNFARKNIEH